MVCDSHRRYLNACHFCQNGIVAPTYRYLVTVLVPSFKSNLWLDVWQLFFSRCIRVRYTSRIFVELSGPGASGLQVWP